MNQDLWRRHRFVINFEYNIQWKYRLSEYGLWSSKKDNDIALEHTKAEKIKWGMRGKKPWRLIFMLGKIPLQKFIGLISQGLGPIVIKMELEWMEKAVANIEKDYKDIINCEAAKLHFGKK